MQAMVRVLGGGLVATVVLGCGPRLNGDHCLFHRGDVACDEGTQCFVAIGVGSVGGDGMGCHEEPPTDDDALRLPYGLPRGVTPEPGIDYEDTVIAILDQKIAEGQLGPTCWDRDTLPPEIGALAGLPAVFGARERLEDLRGERRVDAERARIRAEEAVAVDELNAAIDAWEAECVAMLDPPHTSTSGGTGDDEGSTSDESTTDGLCVSDADCSEPLAPL